MPNSNHWLHDRDSLKDFRTLTACAHALDRLSTIEPKPAERGRRRQLNQAFKEVAQELANTPAVCRKSYVHSVIVEAFNSGRLKRSVNGRRGTLQTHRERMLVRLLQDVGQRASASYEVLPILSAGPEAGQHRASKGRSLWGTQLFAQQRAEVAIRAADERAALRAKHCSPILVCGIFTGPAVNDFGNPSILKLPRGALNFLAARRRRYRLRRQNR